MLRAASSFARLTIASLLASSVASAQTVAWRLESKSTYDYLGNEIALLADVDGDGVPDLAVAARKSRGHHPPPAHDDGRVMALSGATGAVIWKVEGAPDAELGAALESAGDVDGDGVDDVLAGAPGEGKAYVLDGRDGTALLEVSGGVEFGRDVASLGDVDGDARPDFCVGEPAWSQSYADGGRISLRSGRDGSELFHWDGKKAGSRWGAWFVDAGDLDGDGVRDLALLSEPAGVDLLAWSGRTGQSLYKVTPTVDMSPVAFESIGDVDLDGHADFLLLLLWTAGTSDPTTQVRSGLDGRLLQSSNDRFTLGTTAGDVDGDGVPDLCLTTVGYSDVVGHLLSGATFQLLSIVWGADYGWHDLDIHGFAGGVDFDGDGAPDLVAGGYGGDVGLHGVVGALSLSRQKLLWSKEGKTDEVIDVGGPSAVVGDVDGDGRSDVLVASRVLDDATKRRPAWLFSGADGALVRRIAGPVDDAGFATDVAALTDVDHDGTDDLLFLNRRLVGAPGTTLQSRSGATGEVLAEVDAPPGDRIAVHFQPFGAVHVAVGDPEGGFQDAGRVHVLDLASGATLFAIDGKQSNEWFGASLAACGDFDGDGVRDWAAGAPHVLDFHAGLVRALSGADGHELKELVGTSTRYGTSVCAIDDLNGDGIDDLLIGDPTTGSGRVHAHACGRGSWPRLFLAKIAGVASWFGAALGAVGDLNRDGVPDFLASRLDPGGHVYAFSPVTVQPFHDLHTKGDGFGDVLEVAAPWNDDLSPSGDATPDVLVVAPRADVGAAALGFVEMWTLHPLDLVITPPETLPNRSVEAALGGGIAGVANGLYLAAIDGEPIDEFVAFGVFDAMGVSTWSEVVPPSFSGQTLTFRGYGFSSDGDLIRSNDATLTVR